MTEDDFVDILGLQSGIAQRAGYGGHNKTFHGLAFQLAKRGVGPTDNCRAHGDLQRVVVLCVLIVLTCSLVAGKPGVFAMLHALNGHLFLNVTKGSG